MDKIKKILTDERPSETQRTDDDDDLDSDLTPEQRRRRLMLRRIYTIVKIVVLLIVWLYFAYFLIRVPPHTMQKSMVALDPNIERFIDLKEEPSSGLVLTMVQTRINMSLMMNPEKATESTPRLLVTLEHYNSDKNKTSWRSSEWVIYLLPPSTENLFEVEHFFKVPKNEEDITRVALKTDGNDSLSVMLELNTSPINYDRAVVYAALLLCGLYGLIIWEITDRTFAALMASTTAIGILSMMGSRPSLHKIVSWIDINTLMLLFGMMILVAILSETGIFDYLAVAAYRMSKGHPWPLIFFLCMFTGSLSAFLDNVTMVLLMTPVTIRLCEVMALRTTMVLICVVLYSNIGGTLTPVGDPPNVIIATNEIVVRSGINFFNFTIHMAPGVVASMALGFVMLHFMLRKYLFINEEQVMRQSIKGLKKHAAKVAPVNNSEELMREEILRKAELLREQYKEKKSGPNVGLVPVPHFIDTLAELETKYFIRNKPLLIKCAVALIFVILLFFLHSLPFMKGVSLAWAAVLAALLLLILANKEDMQVVLAHVEWSTLLFFAALFVLMEALAEMGLIDWVGEKTVAIILSVSKKHQLVVAIMLMLWISAITSAFVDNIPITTMMLKLTIKLATSKEVDLPLSPLIWALAFGTCFGGNGTLIGASANVVTAGMASQHGYKITFLGFFVIGFPVMILTVVIASVYLLIAHTMFTWHEESKDLE